MQLIISLKRVPKSLNKYINGESGEYIAITVSSV